MDSRRSRSSDARTSAASGPRTDPSGRRAPDQPVLGLAPRDARLWLRLHHAFAWNPEIVTPRLLEGVSPEEIFASLAPRGSRRAGATGPRDLSDSDLDNLIAFIRSLKS